jgi:hypothetical protein
MRDITAGKVVSETARREATTAFEKAGLLTREGEMTSVGLLMLKQEGVKFLARAGIITEEGEQTASMAFAAVSGVGLAAGVVSTGKELKASEKAAIEIKNAARTGEETAEVIGEGSRFLGPLTKKIPVVGQVITVLTAVTGIAGAAQAETLPPEPKAAPQTPEEKRARALLEAQAETQRTKNEYKEGIKGALGLLPIPGTDIAFDKFTDSEDEDMQARMDAATRGGPQPIDVDDLIWEPSVLDRQGPISDKFNAEAQRRGDAPASPAAAAVPAPNAGAAPPKGATAPA